MSSAVPISCGSGTSGALNGRTAFGSRIRSTISVMWIRMYAVAQPSTPARISSMNVSEEAQPNAFMSSGGRETTMIPNAGVRVDGSRWPNTRGACWVCAMP